MFYSELLVSSSFPVKMQKRFTQSAQQINEDRKAAEEPFEDEVAEEETAETETEFKEAEAQTEEKAE